MKPCVTLASLVLLLCAIPFTPTASWAQCMSMTVNGVIYDLPPDQIDFGDVPVNTTGTITVTLRNVPCPDGFQFAVTLGSVQVDNPVPFGVEEDAPPPVVDIPIGGSIDVDVYFSPTEVGGSAGRLVIESNAEPPYTLANVDLIGNGTQTPAWGTASVMGGGHEAGSDLVNRLVFLAIPFGAILGLKRSRKQAQGCRERVKRVPG